jgi:hypothetical protein
MKWSSQDLAAMLSQGLVGRFELIGAHSVEMAVAARVELFGLRWIGRTSP